jgi:hypothetical protein
MINWHIFILSQAFWLAETAYFGWNLTPQSDADIICDGMVVLIGALAFLKPS